MFVSPGIAVMAPPPQTPTPPTPNPNPTPTPPTPNCGCEATDVFSPTAQMEAQLSAEKRRLATTLQQILEAPTDPASLSSGRSQPQPDSSQFHVGPLLLVQGFSSLRLLHLKLEASESRVSGAQSVYFILRLASRISVGAPAKQEVAPCCYSLGRERRHVCLATFRFTFPLSAWRDGSFRHVKLQALSDV